MKPICFCHNKQLHCCCLSFEKLAFDCARSSRTWKKFPPKCLEECSQCSTLHSARQLKQYWWSHSICLGQLQTNSLIPKNGELFNGLNVLILPPRRESNTVKCLFEEPTLFCFESLVCVSVFQWRWSRCNCLKCIAWARPILADPWMGF